MDEKKEGFGSLGKIIQPVFKGQVPPPGLVPEWLLDGYAESALTVLEETETAIKRVL